METKPGHVIALIVALLYFIIVSWHAEHMKNCLLQMQTNIKVGPQKWNLGEQNEQIFGIETQIKQIKHGSKTSIEEKLTERSPTTAVARAKTEIESLTEKVNNLKKQRDKVMQQSRIYSL